MSIFSKIKDNISHGGVDVSLQAPASASMQDPTIPVTITITAQDSSHTITEVGVSLVRQSENQSFGSNDPSTNNTSIETVAHAEDVNPFTINPGETKTVQLNIVMNQAAAMQQALPQDSAMGQFVGAMQKMQNVSNALNGNSYRYELHATANVEGIAFDPGAQQPIQILKPGQIGGAINFGG